MPAERVAPGQTNHPRPVPPTRTAGAWSVGRSVTRTLLLVTVGLLLVGLNILVGYVAVGAQAVAIVTGLVFVLVFMLLVRLLHRAAWLSLLAALPGLLVLVGSVQLAPEALLTQRGVRHDVTIVDVQVTGKRHAFVLAGASGRLDEPLVHQGDGPGYRIGDRLTVVVDPDGVVDLEAADRVDPGNMAGMVVAGAVGWAAIALLAGWRGHVRRRGGRYDSVLD